MDTPFWRGWLALAVISVGYLRGAEPSKAYRPGEVIERRSIQSGDQKITVTRIEPPILKKLEPKAPAAPTAEQQAVDKRRESKRQIPLNLSATVFEDNITELRWSHNGRNYHGYSTANFLLFTGLGELETDDSFYSYSISMGRGSPAETDVLLPQFRIAAVTMKAAQFIVYRVEGGASEEEAYRALDTLHVYYNANKARLHQEFLAREEAYNKRAEELRKNPPRTPDVEVKYWRNDKQSKKR